MAGFYWSIGPNNGAEQIMLLTITSEVSNLQVTSSADSGNQLVPVPDFKPCLPTTQTVACGPIPIRFLPLTATGFGCVPLGQTAPIVPTATSQSPTDPHVDGPNPFCAALVLLGTPEGPDGGSVLTPDELCRAAQNSPALSTARSSFESACAKLRSDQADVTVYSGIAAAATALSTALAAAATAIAFWIVSMIVWTLATVAAAFAIAYSVLASQAASDVGTDESLLDTAQQSWESAVAAVKIACCSPMITINTADLVCA